MLTERFGNTLAVDGLTMEVPRGEVFGFLGPNGAGKTTTMAMLLGLVRRTAGSAELLGQDTAEASALRSASAAVIACSGCAPTARRGRANSSGQGTQRRIPLSSPTDEWFRRISAAWVALSA